MYLEKFQLFKEIATLKINKTNSILFTLVLFGIGMSFSSCSTRRNTAMARAYHNLTSHYNVYWNGKQNLMAGTDELRNKAKDNYGKILRVYNYGNKKMAGQMASLMEITIKKAAMTIQNHSMVFGGKEKVKWVTESYLMMGQAFFYKHDFTGARRVFDFVQKKYNYLSIHYLGTLWLAKTYIEMGDYGKAEASLSLLSSEQNGKGFPNEVKNTLPVVYADLYLAEGNPSTAYPYLEKSIDVIRNKDLLSRVYFIMGQINRREGDLQQAGIYFTKVMKRNPPFQMDFEARLNLARCYDAASGNGKYIVKTLEKMARKNQYEIYRDQIYYALAEVAEKNKNDSLMVYYLRLSVSNSKGNDYQKSTASLKLAEDYFQHGNYIPAQAYYDTAVRFLPQDYPHYAQIKNKSQVLSQLVQNLQSIRIQDSLQRLARMDTTRLYALIDKKIADYKTALAAKKKAAKIKTENLAFGQFTGSGSSSIPTSESGPGGWYFYNSAALSRGFNEFRRRWGQRKLEDLWFLSDKNTTMTNAGITVKNEAGTRSGASNARTGKPKLTSPETRAYYLKELPKTAKDFQQSDSLIIGNYNKLGFLYLEELNDTTDALKTYLALQTKYPDNQSRLQNWYYLYKIYAGLGKTGKSMHYKRLILERYPESLYTKVLNDPDYYKKLESKHNEAENLYSRTYQAFGHEQYYRVITYANRALEKYPNDTAVGPQFMYLRALSLGKVEVPDTLYLALQQLIAKYPHHPLAERSKAIVRMLQMEYGISISEKERQALLAAQNRQKKIGSFVYNSNAPQYILLVTNRKVVNTRALETRLSDFNVKYFRQQPLQISSLILNNNYNLLLVKQFISQQDAMTYYKVLFKDPYVFSGIQKRNYYLFVISNKNYPLFYKEKNVKIYQRFFDEYYK
jgi:tetratricopeptide (TPR) repeat protein